MPFNSYPYLVFIIVIVLAFLVLEKRFPWAKRAFLLLVSYGFYAWWRVDFIAASGGLDDHELRLGRRNRRAASHWANRHANY